MPTEVFAQTGTNPADKNIEDGVERIDFEFKIAGAIAKWIKKHAQGFGSWHRNRTKSASSSHPIRTSVPRWGRWPELFSLRYSRAVSDHPPRRASRETPSQGGIRGHKISGSRNMEKTVRKRSVNCSSLRSASQTDRRNRWHHAAQARLLDGIAR
jgi:hypothetical protein